jgi:hypothetical protein
MNDKPPTQYPSSIRYKKKHRAMLFLAYLVSFFGIKLKVLQDLEATEATEAEEAAKATAAATAAATATATAEALGAKVLAGKAKGLREDFISAIRRDVDLPIFGQDLLFYGLDDDKDSLALLKGTFIDYFFSTKGAQETEKTIIMKALYPKIIAKASSKSSDAAQAVALESLLDELKKEPASRSAEAVVEILKEHNLDLTGSEDVYDAMKDMLQARTLLQYHLLLDKDEHGADVKKTETIFVGPHDDYAEDNASMVRLLVRCGAPVERGPPRDLLLLDALKGNSIGMLNKAALPFLAAQSENMLGEKEQKAFMEALVHIIFPAEDGPRIGPIADKYRSDMVAFVAVILEQIRAQYDFQTPDQLFKGFVSGLFPEVTSLRSKHGDPGTPGALYSAATETERIRPGTVKERLRRSSGLQQGSQYNKIDEFWKGFESQDSEEHMGFEALFQYFLKDREQLIQEHDDFVCGRFSEEGINELIKLFKDFGMGYEGPGRFVPPDLRSQAVASRPGGQPGASH